MALSLELIRRTADRVAASHGLDVVEIEYRGGNKHRLLRIFIEKNREERGRLAEEARAHPENRAEAGTRETVPAHLDGVALDQLAWVTHEDCERFSRDFGTLLDVEDLVPGTEYTLEVSSPGLDRRLSTPADYQRFHGSLVKVQTFAPVAGNRHWHGRLSEVTNDGIVLDLAAVKQRARKKEAAPAEMAEIAFANIEKANLDPRDLESLGQGSLRFGFAWHVLRTGSRVCSHSCGEKLPHSLCIRFGAGQPTKRFEKREFMASVLYQSIEALEAATRES